MCPITRYLHHMKIFLLGYMSSGKTTLGATLAKKLSLPFIDLDKEIETSQGKKITEIFDLDGEENFRQIERDVLRKAVEQNEKFVMATGGGTPCYFKNLDLMKKKGITIYLQVSLKELVRRNLQSKELRPLLRGLNELEIQSYVNHHLKERLPFYKKAGITLNENELDLDRIIQELQLMAHSR